MSFEWKEYVYLAERVVFLAKRILISMETP